MKIITNFQMNLNVGVNNKRYGSHDFFLYSIMRYYKLNSPRVFKQMAFKERLINITHYI